MTDKTTTTKSAPTGTKAKSAPKATAKVITRTAAEEDARQPADIRADSAMPSASGAIIERDALEAIDPDHPAVDNNPRADTTKGQNKIDFNDPTKTDAEAVKANLASGGYTAPEADDADD